MPRRIYKRSRTAFDAEIIAFGSVHYRGYLLHIRGPVDFGVWNVLDNGQCKEKVSEHKRATHGTKVAKESAFQFGQRYGESIHVGAK